MSLSKAIGLMSGTSMDGIDVALVETDGERLKRVGEGMTFSYGTQVHSLILEAVEDARKMRTRMSRTDKLAKAEDAVTRSHAEAIKHFVEKKKLNLSEIEVVGFHGQTVIHRPEKGFTVQLGDGQKLADLTGLDVVYDFRSRDMMSGGQGAPLAPVYHRALANEARLVLPLVVVNIGGVSNVTWIGTGNDMIAFDSGPGNALLDDWVKRHTGQPMDTDGDIARRGKVDDKAVEAFCAQKFFALKPPKSLDRNDFSAFLVEGLDPADGAATLTAITAECIARSVEHMPDAPKHWVISGGGTRNPVLMEMLRSRLDGKVDTAKELGWSPEFMEAEAFAYMAMRSRLDMPITFPGTTGVHEPLSGGVKVSPSKS